MPKEKRHRFQSTEEFTVIAEDGTNHELQFTFPTLARARTFRDTFSETCDNSTPPSLKIIRTVKPLQHLVSEEVE
jgi:hypothetical protein